MPPWETDPQVKLQERDDVDGRKLKMMRRVSASEKPKPAHESDAPCFL